MEIYGKSLEKMPLAQLLVLKPPILAFVDVSCVKSLRAIILPLREAVRRAVFHVTNRGCDVGHRIAKNAARSAESGSILAEIN
jgi:hypothetical protein